MVVERPRTVVVHDSLRERAWHLHMDCQDGDRHACVRLGIMIGEHRERRAEWERTHPEMFRWD